MLRMSPIQMEAFAQMVKVSFAERMVRELLRDFPRELRSHGIVDAEAVRQLVQRGIEEAAQNAVLLERDAYLYLQCMALFGAQFPHAEASAWAAEILSRSDISGTAKMDLIHDHLVFGSTPGLPGEQP